MRAYAFDITVPISVGLRHSEARALMKVFEILFGLMGEDGSTMTLLSKL